VNDTPGMSGCGVFLPHSDREAVEQLADERGVLISDVLREAVSQYLNRADDLLAARSAR
jgi:hypothetical protein